MIATNQMKAALESCYKDISALSSPKGAEPLIQSSLAHVFGSNAQREVSLTDIGSQRICGGENGKIDLLVGNHGVEVKVVQMPRMDATISNALYDIGQISADYWRLQQAMELESAELIILLCGPLNEIFDTPTRVLKEFHNRMFVDYQTSFIFGELSEQQLYLNRSRQVGVIYQMGFDKPYRDKSDRKSIVYNDMALISIPVINS